MEQILRGLRAREEKKVKLLLLVKIDVKVDRLRSHCMLMPWCLNVALWDL